MEYIIYIRYLLLVVNAVLADDYGADSASLEPSKAEKGIKEEEKKEDCNSIDIELYRIWIIIIKSVYCRNWIIFMILLL